MSLSFGLPMALWALAALALPLLLHLARRERQQRTVFAALAWLDPRQRPRRRLRLQEWLLLLLRLLLVAALALLLAQPLLSGGDAPDALVLRHPALARPAGAPPAGTQWRWLAPGFPGIDEKPAPAAPANVSSLLREADAGLAASSRLVVQVPALLDGLDPQPPQLSRTPDWQVEGDANAAAGEPVAPPQPHRQVLRGEADDSSARWLRAVQAAWRAQAIGAVGDADRAHPAATGSGVDAANAGPARPDASSAGELPPPDTVLAWTSAAAPEAAILDWVASGGTLLIDVATPWPLARTAAPLDAEAWLQGAGHGRGRVLQWRQPLAPESLPALLDADFPARLAAQLWPTPEPARAWARHWTPAAGGASPTPAPRPLDPPLLWLIALLFGAERLLATRRAAGAAA